ncbi:AIPR family protein [Brevibacillus thermoruber]|jgi:hypothetical protein|uniref:AIPR family protein n=1 Tax=Brevibacillus thermoruber TaxID=33942 RepID=UPI0004190CBB|nr:AIPR family protein [Brevibacillus thermoruber]
MEKELHAFSDSLQKEILSDSEGSLEKENKFTEIMIDYLISDGTLDDGTVFYFSRTGMKVNGFAFDEEKGRLDLIYSDYSGATPPLTVRNSEIDSGFRRLLNFLNRSINGLHKSLDGNSPEHDLAMLIHESRNEIVKVNLYYLTDRIARKDPIKDSHLGDIQVSFHVWDIERVFRSQTSGKNREEIQIDLNLHSGPVPCLKLQEDNDDYRCYLAFFPGETLVSIYKTYGSRLLERNVRAFLQARGAVNKGIRDTIRTEPHMFLAYNNGISAVAQGVETVVQNGGLVIRKLRDFQIVNGGQTTASIYYAAMKDKLSMKGVYVQVKLTVIKDENSVDRIVPNISRYANTQNKIQNADLAANDSFQRKLEELSRTVWAPSSRGNQRQTRWYYERARGQYLEDRGKESSQSYRKNFDLVFPKSQLFTKTDLAKYENTWLLKPYLVSRGAQKNFQEFMIWLQTQAEFEPNVDYFEDLIARAILFKRAEKIISEQKFGGYRANIVTYTLAWIYNKLRSKINLKQIWKEQDIPGYLEEVIKTVSVVVHNHILNPPGNGNITEWCKKKECWDGLRNKNIEFPDSVKEELKI